jgi:hypothetical protein
VAAQAKLAAGVAASVPARTGWAAYLDDAPELRVGSVMAASTQHELGLDPLK